ncbi:hypothetical protein [Pleionea sediminis]|uniref:hypothetical protein n=1 Tax=Pleionea sediminis TaxID=2569479 RepID=UPI001186C6B1|nr:hypothetical protein [Pleionea sediminis]
MKRITLIALLSMIALTSQVSAKSSRAGVDLGIAYDLDLGATLQFSQYTMFINGDAFAFDVRLENFYNSRKSLLLYIDFGAFYEDRALRNKTVDDRVGVRLPVGLSFSLDRNLEAFIQAVPNYDFNDDNEDNFDIDGAIGIRYRF